MKREQKQSFQRSQPPLQDYFLLQPKYYRSHATAQRDFSAWPFEFSVLHCSKKQYRFQLFEKLRIHALECKRDLSIHFF